MAVIRFGDRPFYRNPWVEFEKIQQEMDRLARGFMHGGDRGRERATVYPPLNISEDENNIYVQAEVAGVAPEDLDISLEEDTLTIKGQRRPVPVEEKVSYHRREVEYGRFNRAVTLPTRVKADGVTARSRDGILTITLPKVEEVKPRRIMVQG